MKDLQEAIGLQPAAAFGRLCVETMLSRQGGTQTEAAAFGRLCVETVPIRSRPQQLPAAAFGRLCVETCSFIINH